MESEYLTYSQVAKRLHLGRSTVMRLIEDGLLPVVYVAKRSPRILSTDLENYLAAQRRILGPDAAPAEVKDARG